MPKKRVLLTGASGSMGGEALKELSKRKDDYDVVLVIRPSKENRRALTEYEGREGIGIVWGDLCNLSDVLEAVDGVDYVLHPAALIAQAFMGIAATAGAITFFGGLQRWPSQREKATPAGGCCA